MYGILPVDGVAVDSDDHALCTHLRNQFIDQAWSPDGRGVHRDLVSTGLQDALGMVHGPDSAGNAEGYVQLSGDPLHPGNVDAAILGACCDIVEDKFIRAFLPIPYCQLDDVADDTMIPETNPLDYFSVSDVQAWYDPSC